VSVAEGVAITDGVNVAGVTAGGALNVNATIGGATAYSFSTNLSSAAGVVKASAGSLITIKCNNRHAANDWLQVFNQTMTPVNTTQSFDQWLLPSGPSMIIVGTDAMGTAGEAFGTGIAYGLSTTSGTLTLGTASNYDCTFGYQ
jgi:hypothetical protein